MKNGEIWQRINDARKQNKKEVPHWPDHICAQAGKVSEATGKLMSKSLLSKYNYLPRPAQENINEQIIDEAVNVAVQAIRFLENLNLSK